MSSVFRRAAFVLCAVAALATAAAMRTSRAQAVVHLAAPPMAVREIAADPGALRVCADPNNLPFSDERGEGFENAIARIVARDLDKSLVYYWLPQRRGFVRNSLRAGVCDLIVGVPTHYELVRTTQAYYRSTYVFVSPRRAPALRSLDDRRLRRMAIGIQITGDDYQNPPAAEALALRHLQSSVRGYPVYGDYSQAEPQRRIIDDVGAGRLDTAIVWGPLAAYFARQQSPPLAVAPVSPASDPRAGPFVFGIAMGVRAEDARLQQALDRIIERRRPEIDAILRRFAVPLVSEARS